MAFACAFSIALFISLSASCNDFIASCNVFCNASALCKSLRSCTAGHTAEGGASKARDTVSNRADSVRDTEEAGESGFGSANVSVAGIYRCEECIEEFIIV